MKDEELSALQLITVTDGQTEIVIMCILLQKVSFSQQMEANQKVRLRRLALVSLQTQLLPVLQSDQKKTPDLRAAEARTV